MGTVWEKSLSIFPQCEKSTEYTKWSHELNFISRFKPKKEKNSKAMHFTFIFVVMLISFSKTHSHPTSPAVEPNEENLQRARPIQQFFKNILNALRPTTTELPPLSTTKRNSKPSLWQQNAEVQEIPNFVDFSTYLLDSISNDNSIIKFTYLQPNSSDLRSLRGNYSVISVLVPHDTQDDKKEDKKKGILSFLNSLRLPWNRQSNSNTVYSKFPPVLEYFTQRIQAYFSVYKYSDDSRINNTIVVLMPQNYQAINSSDIQSDEGIETTTDYQTEDTTPSSQEDDTTIALNEVIWWSWADRKPKH